MAQNNNYDGIDRMPALEQMSADDLPQGDKSGLLSGGLGALLMGGAGAALGGPVGLLAAIGGLKGKEAADQENQAADDSRRGILQKQMDERNKEAQGMGKEARQYDASESVYARNRDDAENDRMSNFLNNAQLGGRFTDESVAAARAANDPALLEGKPDTAIGNAANQKKAQGMEEQLQALQATRMNYEQVLQLCSEMEAEGVNLGSLLGRISQQFQMFGTKSADYARRLTQIVTGGIVANKSKAFRPVSTKQMEMIEKGEPNPNMTLGQIKNSATQGLQHIDQAIQQVQEELNKVQGDVAEGDLPDIGGVDLPQQQQAPALPDAGPSGGQGMMALP